MTELQQTDGTTTESLYYEYNTSGDNVGRIESVTLRRRVGEGALQYIQPVVYDYYDSEDDTYGTIGDLKTATRQMYQSSNWVDTDVSYYRYCTTDSSSTFVHGLQYVLGPAAYAKMVADGYDPMSDAVDDYADYYFEYENNSSRRVSREVVDGGNQEYFFDYTANVPYNSDYNNWRQKTVESWTENSQSVERTVYTNHIGQVLLKQLAVAGGDSWTEYFVYDEDGRMTEHWTPAAVASYVDDGGEHSDELVVTPAGNGDDGLIYVNEYSDTTTATDSTAGYVEGYIKYRKIKKGPDGDAILLSEVKYLAQTVDDETTDETTIYPIAEETVYQSDADGGSDPVTTTYGYDWYPDTHQIKERTTTLPAVSTGKNGSGASNVRKEYFDPYGNLVWSKDERGRLTYHAYDAMLGVATQTIVDVDSDQSSGLNPPTGYAGNSDGLHLTSDFSHDSLGRTTEALGPAHNINGTTVRLFTWTTYDDVNHEVRTAVGAWPEAPTRS